MKKFGGWHMKMTMGRIGLIAALIAVAVVIAAGAAWWAQSRGPTAIQAAATACDTEDTVYDDGTSLSLQLTEQDASEWDPERYISPESFACVTEELNMPAAVRDRFLSSRPMDGQLEESWEGFTMKWSVGAAEANVTIEQG